MVIVLTAGGHYTFPYENYKGEIKQRRVAFEGLDYGSNEWYPEDQWFMRTWDFDKNAPRSFALNKIDPRKIANLI